MLAWKLFRCLKGGVLAPLFINKKQRIERGVWLKAEAHETKGFAYRPGWHVTAEPFAPHLSNKGRVWVRVEIQDFVEVQRPASQGGVWFLANNMKVL